MGLNPVFYHYHDHIPKISEKQRLVMHRKIQILSWNGRHAMAVSPTTGVGEGGGQTAKSGPN